MLFHLLHLGRVYLPLCALPFFVRPILVAITAVLVPLLSGAVTGMPPCYPPIAVFMSIELAVMAGLIACCMHRWPRANEWLVLISVLLLGRVLYVALVYGFSLVIQLPAGFMAGLSFVGGWPGIISSWPSWCRPS